MHMNCLVRPARQSGLTLIELMIGFVITGILVVMAVPSFASWLQSSQIRTAAGSILDGLQLARTEAIRRNTTVRFVLDDDSGWHVAVVDNATPPNELQVVQTRSSQEGSRNAVVSVAPTAGTGVSFGALGWVVGSSVATTFTQIDIASSVGDGRNLRVTVSPSGTIRMCDPVVAGSADPDIPSDPRSCG
jgi:type IV fimbrial biogenesis protein FimT